MLVAMERPSPSSQAVAYLVNRAISHAATTFSSRSSSLGLMQHRI